MQSKKPHSEEQKAVYPSLEDPESLAKENIEPNIKKPLQPRYKFYYDMGYIIDPKVGLIYTEKEAISNQRSLAFTMIKQVGSNIFQGKSLTDLSLPVSVFEPCSTLERLARLFQYAPSMVGYLSHITDPLERFRRVIAWSVATLHLGISQNKPFDSALGETMQASIGGLSFYAEQRDKTTPTMVLVGNDFYLYGDHRIIPHTYPNSAKVVTEGIKTLILCGPVPGHYTVTQPEVLLNGIMMGKRTFRFQGDILFEDVTNKLYGVIRMNPNAKGFFSGLFSSKPSQREDYFKGFITSRKELVKNPKDEVFGSKEVLSKCEGNWIDNIMFDGKVYWDLEQFTLSPVVKADWVLPSDTSFRKDIEALRKGAYAEAQKLKEGFEAGEKHDQKLREKWAKIMKGKK